MKNILLLFLFSLVPLLVDAQVVTMGSREKKMDVSQYNGIQKKNVRLFTVGIGKFSDKEFDNLNAVAIMNRFKEVSEDYLRLSYTNQLPPTYLNKQSVTVKEVRDALRNLTEETTEADFVIVSILSHGEVNNGEYYLVCSDTNSSNYSGTAISGTELRSYFETMANKGAVVIVFLDTCHAAALFENRNFSPRSGNGGLAYYASSKSDQAAKEINQNCRFTETVLDIFLNRNKLAFNEHDYVVVKSMAGEITHSLSNVTSQNLQEPVSKWFSNLDAFDDYPIIINKYYKDFSVWEHPIVFSPISVSPSVERNFDYVLIGVEGASILGMIVCGPILQESYKYKIANSDDPYVRNTYRERGRNAAIGFCVSAGLFLSSYTIKTIHVARQYEIAERNKQYASLIISPVMSPYYNGLSLVLNF